MEYNNKSAHELTFDVYRIDKNSGKKLWLKVSAVTIMDEQKKSCAGFRNAYTGMEIPEKNLLNFFKANKIAWSIQESLKK